MGFGDPDHPHPLNLYRKSIRYGDPQMEGNCFRCELPITRNDNCYGCARCNHLVHQLCFELPQNMRHPLHPQHSLKLSPSPSSQITTVCNQCHDPFLGGYMYHCESCPEFNLHLKCFLTPNNLKQKHEHPLNLYEVEFIQDKISCLVCGLPIDDIDSFTFACKDCNVYVHFDCNLIPPTVKHHHRDELTFEYNYPEESDLAYCDVCEDKDDEELDRNLSYYYCKDCDYIAHVRCVTTIPARVITNLEHHVHPMVYSRKPRRYFDSCGCFIIVDLGSYYLCDQCNYRLHESCANFPRFIKHPRHKEHFLSISSAAALNPDGELSFCNFCQRSLEGYQLVFQCKDCDYVEHFACATSFKHPYHAELCFSAFYNTFRCNACGDIGEGYRMSDTEESLPLQYDLHLECFALPGRIEHDCHPHPLYLTSSPTKINSLFLSTTFSCDIGRAEADPKFWIYCCKECNYIAHLKCVASDLLSAVRPSNNFVDLCSVTECLKGQFIDEVKPDMISTCLRLVREDPNEGKQYPVFTFEGLFKDPKSPIGDPNRRPMILDVTDLDKPFADVLHCPECKQAIPVQAYSCVYNWVHRNVKADIYPVQVETLMDHESLSMLDEKVVDKLYCSICNQLIFSPTYSCAGCQIFFHKSCAELPRKYTDDADHIFLLQSPVMCNGNLTKCKKCKHPIKGYAYFCASCDIALDVTCALGAPLLKLESQKHSFFGWIEDGKSGNCNACGHHITEGSFCFKCGANCCVFNLHVECALLPYSVKHRIHQHPLVLEPHLDLTVDDYICDVCEDILNPCIWVYRCSDSCGDRATSHVSCIITSNKKRHFIYDEECSYPHLDRIGEYISLKQNINNIPDLTPFLEQASSMDKKWMLHNILIRFVNEFEHDYAPLVTNKLVNKYMAEVLQWMKSPDALKPKVEETMKSLFLSDPDDNVNNADGRVI